MGLRNRKPNSGLGMFQPRNRRRDHAFITSLRDLSQGVHRCRSDIGITVLQAGSDVNNRALMARSNNLHEDLQSCRSHSGVGVHQACSDSISCILVAFLYNLRKGLNRCRPTKRVRCSKRALTVRTAWPSSGSTICTSALTAAVLTKASRSSKHALTESIAQRSPLPM